MNKQSGAQAYGFFISHKSEDWALAGRIYDYLSASGYRPFLDIESLHQGNFDEALEQIIKATPYFLLVLSPNTFKEVNEKSWVLREIRVALKSDSNIFLIATEDFAWPKDTLPEDVEQLYHKHIYYIGRRNFYEIMKKLVDTDIAGEKLGDIMDWREKALFLSQTYMSSRESIEKSLGTLEARFGTELVECVRRKEPFEGENHIKSIRMSCYAASLLLAPQINMVDGRAFDRGILFNILAELLRDDDFSLEIVITAPGSMAAKEAAESEKLGNSRLEEYPEAIFLSSYSSIFRLIDQDPVFAKARRERRFNFMVTDMAMPYSIFQINYKTEYEYYDHIKLDLYSEGLTSNMDRRSMLIFKKTDPENYLFFEERYKYIRNLKRSARLIQENHDGWIKAWEALKEEIGYEE
ncbi:MAG: toll/interleukin-1 receptor domain-containing protein [Clostridia bacterium]|nr:toll/interleukin-1 receptor domain-containing protein [Clostridia bacterium]